MTTLNSEALKIIGMHEPALFCRAASELYFRNSRNDATNFTAILYDLIAKADPMNRIKLRAGFPVECDCFRAWQLCETLEEIKLFFETYAKPAPRLKDAI